MDFVWWIAACIGHLGISAVIHNQIHATSYPRFVRKLSEKILVAIAGLCGVYWLWVIVTLGTLRFWPVAGINAFNKSYLMACLFAAACFTARWFYRKWFHNTPAEVISHTVEKHDVQKQIGQSVYHGLAAKILKCIPGNQAHLIASDRMTFHVPNLPPSLEGVRICHLSDFHLTGQIDRRYFAEVVKTANRFNPDLILVTGDLIDESICLDWIEEIFGNLSAKYDVLYVLGNHDRRIKQETMLRQRLNDSGMIGVTGKWQSIEINGATIAFAGNELPWFPHAAELKRYEEPGADGQTPPPADLKILLSHSPDQFSWALDYGFDLMFAGHTHGGQIQIPIVGPIVAPSRYGIRFASGTFKIENMLMHVSRGISGDKCIRLNCPPEVGLITLTGGKGSEKSR